jgi:hypothetical protein
MLWWVRQVARDGLPRGFTGGGVFFLHEAQEHGDAFAGAVIDGIARHEIDHSGEADAHAFLPIQRIDEAIREGVGHDLRPHRQGQRELRGIDGRGL